MTDLDFYRENYFETLYEKDPSDSSYRAKQQQLVPLLEDDNRFQLSEARLVGQALTRGEVDYAFDIVCEVLEE